jgi:hypothetical protein
MTLHPGTTLRHGKGKPEGSAVTGKARKPWVAESDLVSEDAANHNNSNRKSSAGRSPEKLEGFSLGPSAVPRTPSRRNS